ncbi:MAG: DNA-binding protein [Candidatus Bathyarchaeota archaeon]|nr:DNA-binding protein [Candidatus Bathyarchaeota archaeon]
MSKKEFVAAEAKLGRLVVGRVTPRTDLVHGIAKVCEAYGIKSGVVISAIGSLQRARLHYVVSDAEDPLGTAPGPDLHVEGPVELGSCHGLICEDEEGEVSVHLHASVMGKSKKVYSGHVTDKGNPVAVTVDFSILETQNIRIIRRFDPQVGRVMTQPEAIIRSSFSSV